MKTDFLIRAVSTIAALFVSFASMGQEEGFVTLYGHISDAHTSESLFYSSVTLGETSISNVSNSEGYFSLKVPVSVSPDAKVLVSHLGYRTLTVKVAEFNGRTSDGPLEIKLVPEAISLDPATIKAIDAEVLVRSALYKIKDNYPGTRVGMTAFYREMIRKGTAKYLALNEAVIDIDKAPYTGFSSDKVGIYKGRGSTNFEPSDSLLVKCQGGIITVLELDQVKGTFAGLYFHDALMKYSFSVEGVQTYDGHSFYKVGFEPKPHVDDILFKGYVYIETECYAIGRVEMEMLLTGREEEASNIFVVKSPRDTRFYANKAQYVSSYKCYDGMWYYDYCRADLSMSARNRNSLFKRNFTLTEEMAITDHKNGGIAIEPASRVKFKDVLSDKVADFADENFWGENNIIEPDESIDNIIKKIVRKLGNRK